MGVNDSVWFNFLRKLNRTKSLGCTLELNRISPRIELNLTINPIQFGSIFNFFLKSSIAHTSQPIAVEIQENNLELSIDY